jgi:hypothetical protein
MWSKQTFETQIQQRIMASDFLHEQETDHKLEELHPSELHLCGCCSNMPSQQPTCEDKGLPFIRTSLFSGACYLLYNKLVPALTKKDQRN